MYRTRLGIVLFCLFVLIVGALPGAAQKVEAIGARDTASTCSALAQNILGAVKQACGTASGTLSITNTACLGADSVLAAFAGSANPAFKTKGDRVNLADLTALTTSAAATASGNWGMAVLNIQADLPAASKGITAILFGDANLISRVRSTDLKTLPVMTKGDIVLLRSGAAQTYPGTSKLLPSQSASVDGRNKAGDWLRVRLERTVGWAFAAQLRVKGDLESLAVLDDTDIVPSFLYTNPMQSVVLQTNPKGECKDEAPSGLLLQLTSAQHDQVAALNINGAQVEFSNGLLFVRATPKDRLEIAAIDGSATVIVAGNSVVINAGEWTRIKLGGQDGLAAISAPSGKSDYPFALVAGAPIAALPDSLACTVGLSAANNTRVAVRVGPGDERGSLFFMSADSSYKAIGVANDAKGAPWWKLQANNNNSQAWVAQSSVRAIGACDQVAKADIPPVIAAPVQDSGGDTASNSASNAGSGSNTSNTGANGGATTADSAGPSFAPTAQSIWNVNPGLDKLVGDCPANVQPINYCPSLVALTPRGTGLMYKGQELNPYYMARVKDNVYAYAGASPEALGAGRIKLTLVFTSQSNWTITRVLTLNEAPACQHVYTFTGEFLR